jgi:hypothetical protein
VNRVTVLSIAVAAALAFAVPAGATPPFSETVTESAVDVMSCNGFDAVIERTFTGRVTVYFDDQGNPLRVQINVAMTGSVTNSVTGTSIPLRGHVHLVDDFRTGVVTFIGPVFLANDPGRGIVIQDTGRIGFSGDEIVFQAGPHEAIDNPEVLCTAVA